MRRCRRQRCPDGIAPPLARGLSAPIPSLCAVQHGVDDGRTDLDAGGSAPAVHARRHPHRADGRRQRNRGRAVPGSGLHRHHPPFQGPGRCGAGRGRAWRVCPGHTQPHATDGGGAGRRRAVDGGGVLLHRHGPGGPARGAVPGHPGAERAVQQHPQRGGADGRRDRHAAAPHPATQRGRASWRLGQVRHRQLRGARQDAGHRRLWQHRQPVGHAGRGDGHARRLFRPDGQAADRQHRRPGVPGGPAGGVRRRQPACAGHPGDAGHDRRGAGCRDEARRVPHQQQPRQRRGPGRPGCRVAVRPPGGCCHRRVPARAEVRG